LKVLYLDDSAVLIGSKRIYEGKVISLRIDDFRSPGGSTFKREVVEHPGAVAILPFLDDGRLLLIRQYRHAAGKVLLEIPAGTLDEDEEPENCARRELVEETGYEAQVMDEVLSCFLAPGYSSERIHLFLASGLRMVGSKHEIDESIELEPTDIERVEVMINSGEIIDAKTIAGIAYYLLTKGSRR
jgi:ADP-ribose pyrophosphatase